MEQQKTESPIKKRRKRTDFINESIDQNKILSENKE